MPDEPDPIDEAWTRLETQWNDAEAHRRFIGLCAALDRLPEAGRRYREVRETDPERQEVARAQIDRLLTYAMRSLEAVRTPPSMNRGRRILLAIAVVLTIGMIGITSYLVLRR